MTTATQNRPDAGDTVIREVRRSKERLAQKFDCDVWRIAADARTRQRSSRREVVTRAKRADEMFQAAIKELE